MRDNIAPSTRPPVRIFLGTEAGQYRAERVFIWSIEQMRDPSRVYEIHLMKDIAGFDRRLWLTGFTNYRFAIPHFCGRSGRAIYNDVDQIYLTDPAELFDCDMGGHGFLAITPRDTSVMLIDCARMGSVWPLEAARHERRKSIETRSRIVPGLWGPLKREWNSRDLEYDPERSRLLHYTTIHMQPWMPFPNKFVYQHNPVGHVWLDLERSADRAGYNVFTLAKPSNLYRSTIERLRKSPADSQQEIRDRQRNCDLTVVAPFPAKADAHSLIEFNIGVTSGLERSLSNGRELSIAHFDPVASKYAVPDKGPFDAVVSSGGLESLSDEDVPWMLDEMFRRAQRLVVVLVVDRSRRLERSGHCPIEIASRGVSWWRTQLETAAARHPKIHWKLGVRSPSTARIEWREGGRRLAGEPRVWVLLDYKPGHTTQSVGLAEALGWPYEIKDPRMNRLQAIADRLLGQRLRGRSQKRRAMFASPWPDLVISTGWSTVPLVRWIRRQSGGRSRLVQMGRKGGDVAERFDLVATCSHVRFPPHPRRVEIVAPLNAVTPERLAAAGRRWPNLFAGAPRPRIVLLVGGNCAAFQLDTETALRMGEQVGAMAARAGTMVVAVTSRRTPLKAAKALANGLGRNGRVHYWDPDERDNPYLAYLAGADALVVTGDSESMLAEAIAASKPVYIYPLPARRPSPGRWLAARITARAYVRPRKKKKGTIRPQQGREYICARLLERGLVRPPQDLATLHHNLIERGLAHPFGAPFSLDPPPRLSDIDEVVARVQALIGYGAPAAARSSDEAPPEEPRRTATVA